VRSLVNEENSDHDRHGDDRKNGRNRDKLGSLNVVAAVFRREEAEARGGRKGLNECADNDNFLLEMKRDKEKIGDERTDNELNGSRKDEAPLFDELFEVGMGKHEADTNNRESGRGIASEADGIFNEARDWEVEKKNEYAEKDSNDIWVCDDALDELGGNFAFEKVDAVGEECDVEGDDEAAVRDDALLAEGAGDDWVAEEGGVVEDEGELRFEAEFAFVEAFGEDNTRGNNKSKHDDNTSNETRDEEFGSSGAVGGRECIKKRGRHKDSQKQIDKVAIGLGRDEFCFAEEKSQYEN